jgi:mono/diheme cytochrome c family protein
MYIRKLFTWSASALLFPANPCYPADAAHGLDLAKRWCATCHLVSPEQQRASADVPPFATIAKSSNFDPKRLAYFLLEPHPKMPQMALSRSAADDIAAYIETLKK